MYRSTIIIVALSLCIMLSTQTKAKPEADSSVRKKAVAPTIAITGLEISEKILELRYHIKNDSGHDIWICDDIESDDRIHDEEVCLGVDSQTLMIRKRFDVPPSKNIFGNMISGRYIRLRAGEELTYLLLLPLPVYPFPVFYDGPQTQDLKYATRLALEIGYYTGDLPGMIRNILREEEKLSENRLEGNQAINENDYGGLFYFNEYYEGMRHRDEQVLIDHPPYKALKGEQILMITVESIRIPYHEKRTGPKLSPPDLSNCTRIEIQYNPSILDYFFPYAAERNLISLEEMQNMQSIKTIVVEDQERIKGLAHDVSLGIQTGGIINERSMAYVVCYQGNERLKSFKIYNDTSLVTEGKNRFRFYKGLTSLLKLTTQIRPFELREKCSINLRDLWNRFNSYYMIEKIEMAYPPSTEWCDTIVRAYEKLSMNDEYVKGPFKCPSAGEGKCHYAMNPNCKPDSPPDTVLLFETKSGWNQHGGPELFTFDNHRPRGGCVLLNDGTVKFIRTKEELQQLRWQ